MAKDFKGRTTKFMPFKRTKPGIGAENRSTVGRNLSTGRRLTQFGFGACSSGTLVHFSDPT